MDPKIVRKLENEIEESIAAVLERLGPRDLPIEPSGRTMHSMAKAAVAVYEAAVAEHRSE